MLSLANLLFVSSDNCKRAYEFFVQFKTWVGIKCNANWLANLFNRHPRIVTVEVSLNAFLKGKKSIFSGTTETSRYSRQLRNKWWFKLCWWCFTPCINKLRYSVRPPCNVMKRKGSIVEADGRICSCAQEFNCDWPFHQLTSWSLFFSRNMEIWQSQLKIKYSRSASDHSWVLLSKHLLNTYRAL